MVTAPIEEWTVWEAKGKVEGQAVDTRVWSLMAERQTHRNAAVSKAARADDSVRAQRTPQQVSVHIHRASSSQRQAARSPQPQAGERNSKAVVHRRVGASAQNAKCRDRSRA